MKKFYIVVILIYFINGFKSLEDLWNMNELTPFVSNNFREIFGDGEQFSDTDIDVRISIFKYLPVLHLQIKFHITFRDRPNFGIAGN